MRKLLAAGVVCAWVISCEAQNNAGVEEAPKDVKVSTSDARAATPLSNLYVKVNLKEGEVVKAWDSVFNGGEPLTIGDLYPSSIAGSPVSAKFHFELSKDTHSMRYDVGLAIPVKREKTKNDQREVLYQGTGAKGELNIKIGEPMMLFNNGERMITVTVFDKPWPAK